MEDKSSTSCTICLGELDGRTTKTKCGHEFCSDCIFSNIALSKTNKNKCPNCREDICPPVEPSIGWSTQIHIEHLEEEVLSLSRQRHSLKKTNNELTSKNKKHIQDIFKLKYNNAELAGECEYYTIKYHENLKQKLLLMDANRKLREQLKISQTRLADNVKIYSTGSLLPHCSNCSEDGHSTEECSLARNHPCLNCKGEHTMKNCPSFLKVLLSDFTDENAIRLRLVKDGYYNEEENRVHLEAAVFQNRHDLQHADFEEDNNLLSSDDDSLPDLIPMSNEVIPPTTAASAAAVVEDTVSAAMTIQSYENLRQTHYAWIDTTSLPGAMGDSTTTYRSRNGVAYVTRLRSYTNPVGSMLLPHERLRQTHYAMIEAASLPPLNSITSTHTPPSRDELNEIFDENGIEELD